MRNRRAPALALLGQPLVLGANPAPTHRAPVLDPVPALAEREFWGAAAASEIDVLEDAIAMRANKRPGLVLGNFRRAAVCAGERFKRHRTRPLELEFPSGAQARRTRSCVRSVRTLAGRSTVTLTQYVTGRRPTSPTAGTRTRRRSVAETIVDSRNCAARSTRAGRRCASSTGCATADRPRKSPGILTQRLPPKA